jgi:DNA-binding CsgD family transcriptional regulator
VSSQLVPHRIERICAGTLGAKALREQVLAEIRRALPFDAHVWLLTDPVSRVGTSPLADVPGLSWSRLPDLARRRYLTRVNRWTDLADAGTPVATLHEATGGDLAVSGLWREAQRPLGVTDVATVVFGDRFGCWAWLELWRYAPAAPFAAADRAYLGALAAPVTAGVRRAQARTFVAHTPAVDVGGPAVLVLDPNLHVRVQTEAAAEALHQLNPPDEPIPAIPAAAYNVAAALVAQEHGVSLGPPWSRIHLGQGRWLTLRASRISPTGTNEGDIAVSIAASTPVERLEVFALAHGLSRREREVLAELATGADTRALARRLVVSEHTVNDHVKSVLAKTGTTTRQTLLSRIAGTG